MSKLEAIRSWSIAYQILLCSLFSFQLLSQNVAKEEFAASFLSNTILAKNLKESVYALSNDSMQGREFGTAGERKAANWIASKLKEYNIELVPALGNYFQEINFKSYSWDELLFQSGSSTFEQNRDYFAYPGSARNMSISGSEIIFIGFGLELPNYNEFDGVDIKGQIVMIQTGMPMTKDSVIWLTGKKWTPESEESLETRVKRVLSNGAIAVLVVDPGFKKRIRRDRSKIYTPVNLPAKDSSLESLGGNYMVISPEMANQLAGDRAKKLEEHQNNIAKKGKPTYTRLYATFEWQMKPKFDMLSGVNVIGMIPASDPNLQQEAVVLSAHFDHLGIRDGVVYNGADDNASGSASILEIIRTLQEAKKQGQGPRRNVIVIFFSGEEKGLYGSEYYTQSPLWPLEQTIADVNVDMVGRVDKRHPDNPDYIYVIGADRLSQQLADIQVIANNTYCHLQLDETYNALNDPNRYYYRSDHYNFAKNGVPSVFYFSGTHSDYHKSTDDADLLNYPLLEKRCKFIFFVLWELANRNTRLRMNLN
ncbi:MAG: M28 family peptidase [Saprospiraceae bacterium]